MKKIFLIVLLLACQAKATTVRHSLDPNHVKLSLGVTNTWLARISNLSNLTTNGFVKTSDSNGLLSVDAMASTADWNDLIADYDANMPIWDDLLADYDANMPIWNDLLADYDANELIWTDLDSDYDANQPWWSATATDFDANVAGYDDVVSDYDANYVDWVDTSSDFDANFAWWSATATDFDANVADYDDVVADFDSNQPLWTDLLADFDANQPLWDDLISDYDANELIWTDLVSDYDANQVIWEDLLADFDANQANWSDTAADYDANEGAWQPVDTDLTAIAALVPTDSNIIVGSAGGWVIEGGNTMRTSLGLGTGDSPTLTGLTLTGTGWFNDVNITGDTSIIRSAHEIDLRPNDDEADYFQFYVSSLHPRLKVIGGATAYLESDDAGSVELLVGTSGTNRTRVYWNKTSTYGVIDVGAGYLSVRSQDKLELMSNGDSTDFIELETKSDVPTIGTSGDCDLQITPSSGNIDCNDCNLVDVGTLFAADVNIAAYDVNMITDIQWTETKLQYKYTLMTNGVMGAESGWTDVPTN